MDRFELQKLNAKPIETVAGRLGINVAHHKALCPFHDDHHASLSFSSRRNTCRCFVCMDHSLRPIDLVKEYRGMDFLEACRWLTEMDGDVWRGPGDRPTTASRGGGRNSSFDGNRGVGNGNFANGGNYGNGGTFGNGGGSGNGSTTGGGSFGNSGGSESVSDKAQPVFDTARYERFFIDPWLSDEARRFLFTERRLDERVVRWCRLTSWTDRHGTPWLCIPYYDPSGRLIGVQNRNLAWRGHTGEQSGGASQTNVCSPAIGGESSKGTDLSTAIGKPGGISVEDGIPNGSGASEEIQSPVRTSTGIPSSEWKSPRNGSGLSGEGKPSKVDPPTNGAGPFGGIPSSERKSPTDGSGAAGDGKPPKEESPAEVPRFRFPRGARCSVYGLQIVPRLRDGDDLYITEGCSDCWAMLSSGHKAIAVPSATLLSPADARMLTDLGSRLHLRWHMYPDRDVPGERLFLQLRDLLPTLEHHHLPPGCKDYSDAFLKSVERPSDG